MGHRGSCFDICHRVFCLCFPLSFIVSGITFRSLIHFEFIFVYGVRRGFNFILLYILFQTFHKYVCSCLVFPAPFTKETVFSPLYILASFVKNKVDTWVYFWASYIIIINSYYYYKSLQLCPTLCNPHRRQPIRLPCPRDSPGKNTGVGCHFLLQCMKVKSESEVATVVSASSRPHGLQPSRLLHP